MYMESSCKDSGWYYTLYNFRFHYETELSLHQDCPPQQKPTIYTKIMHSPPAWAVLESFPLVFHLLMYLRISTWREIICTSDILHQLPVVKIHLNPHSVRILTTTIHKIILPTSLAFSDVIVLKNCPSMSSISNMSVSHMNTTAQLVTILIITC